MLTEKQSNIWDEQWRAWQDRGEQLVAPSLLHYEVCNGLYKYQKAGHYTSHTISKKQDFVLRLPIRLVGEATIHERALQIATEYGLSATYDAHYLAVSELFNCNLWTADAKLGRQSQPYTNRVQVLK